MQNVILIDKAQGYLDQLCLQIPNRRLGSDGNRVATHWAAGILGSFGFDIETSKFDCLDWVRGRIELSAGGKDFNAKISPYSIGCSISALLVSASTTAELEAIQPHRKILLLLGDITREQLMPRNFPFYNPEHHQEIYRLLDVKNPLAIITATSRNPELAGGLYPFPMIEDGDFDIPSAYITDVNGEELVKYVGEEIALVMESQRHSAKGNNVIARKGFDGDERVVLCAHIDAKEDTPGALDNGTGVVMLLILAELLQSYSGSPMLEIASLNGEDHYSAQGQKTYVLENTERFDDIVVAINTDVAGNKGSLMAVSSYNLPDEIASITKAIIKKYPQLCEGQPWYQSDHSIFIQNGVPAIAVTSENFMELSTTITHTENDIPDLVDFGNLIDTAYAIHELIISIQKGTHGS